MECKHRWYCDSAQEAMRPDRGRSQHASSLGANAEPTGRRAARLHPAGRRRRSPGGTGTETAGGCVPSKARGSATKSNAKCSVVLSLPPS